MKILVFCPTYKTGAGDLAIYSDCRESIDALERGEHEVTVVIRPSPSEDKTGNVILQYQWAEAETRRGGYAAVLFIEHDMIVPPDCLVKMAATEADVVYAPYLFRHTSHGVLSAFRDTSSLSIDQSLQMFPQDLRRARAAVVWPVSGLGFGCTFIRAHVFDKVHIRMPSNGHYPDGPFAEDCKRMGLRQVARFDCLCGHIKPDGFILWPKFDGRDMATQMIKVRINRSFNANLGGISVPCTAGTEILMPPEDATEYQRAGLLQIIDTGPQIKIKNRPERKLQATVK